MIKVKFSRLKMSLVYLIGSIVFFSWGLGVGKFQVFPYQYLEEVNALLLPHSQEPPGLGNEVSLLDLAFTDEIIESELLYSPLTTIEGIQEKNSQIFVELDNFESIYDDIEVVDAQLLSLDSGATSIQKVSFNFRGKHFDAFAYALINQEGGSKTSTLVIPGSGLNQASMIFKKNPNNYHFSLFEILAELKNNDSYIFIHPNEGVLAFHNGSHKLNYNFITNYQINNGGSYSASYLIQTIAFEKYLKLKYSQTIIMGLSQGGLATMINALESEPDIAIVSSGYSVLNEKIEWSGHDQIIIPGISKRLRAENVKDELAQSKTSWLFTYGLKEKGIYKMEANQSLTASLIDDLPNVDVDIHQEGHQFPVKEINRFLQNKLK